MAGDNRYHICHLSLMSEAVFAQDRTKTRLYIRQTLRYSMMVIGAAVTVLVAQPETLFSLLPKGYSSGALALVWLAPAYFCFSLFNIANTLLISSGRAGACDWSRHSRTDSLCVSKHIARSNITYRATRSGKPTHFWRVHNRINIGRGGSVESVWFTDSCWYSCTSLGIGSHLGLLVFPVTPTQCHSRPIGNGGQRHRVRGMSLGAERIQ